MGGRCDLRRQKKPRVRRGMMIKSSLIGQLKNTLNRLVGVNLLPLGLALLLPAPVGAQVESLLIIPGRRVFSRIRRFGV